MSQSARILSLYKVNGEEVQVLISRSINAEDVQSLLDAGHSPNKTATLVGVHHMYIVRMLRKGVVELYVAFDEQEANPRFVPVSECLVWRCEDALDGVIKAAFETCRANIREYINQETSLYLRVTYGGFFRYLRKKKFTPLADCFYKSCSICGAILPIIKFSPSIDSFAGIDSGCKACRYSSTSKDIYARAQVRRRARKRGLPANLNVPTTGWDRRCELSGILAKTHVDHFIPISIGHAGSYAGNFTHLAPEINSSKSDANPFEWFEANGQRFELSQSAFDSLVAKLAAQNGLTPEEFRDFTYWCFANKRTVEQVHADNLRYGYKKPSLEIWREETGLAFPIRVDFGDLSLDRAQGKEATAA